MVDSSWDSRWLVLKYLLVTVLFRSRLRCDVFFREAHNLSVGSGFIRIHEDLVSPFLIFDLRVRSPRARSAAVSSRHLADGEKGVGAAIALLFTRLHYLYSLETAADHRHTRPTTPFFVSHCPLLSEFSARNTGLVIWNPPRQARTTPCSRSTAGTPSRGRTPGAPTRGGGVPRIP